MTSPTRWTWVWASTGSWWWTGKPGVLQFMGSQRVGHDWVTELNLTELITISLCILKKCSLLYLIVFSSFFILLYISFLLSTLGIFSTKDECSCNRLLFSHILGSKNNFGRGVGCGGGGREVQEGGDTCIHIADTLCCAPETQHCKAIILQ